MDYFKLFNLKRKFNIDINLLYENFHKLQLQFHPDLFRNQSEFKKEMILKKSIRINEGYTILKDSLNRALYLLSLYGLEISTEKIPLCDRQFLKKSFFFQEQLEMFKKNHAEKKQYIHYIHKIKREIKKCENNIDIELNNKNWSKAIEIVIKLRFFINIHNRFKIDNTII